MADLAHLSETHGVEVARANVPVFGADGWGQVVFYLQNCTDAPREVSIELVELPRWFSQRGLHWRRVPAVRIAPGALVVVGVPVGAQHAEGGLFQVWFDVQGKGPRAHRIRQWRAPPTRSLPPRLLRPALWIAGLFDHFNAHFHRQTLEIDPASAATTPDELPCAKLLHVDPELNAPSRITSRLYATAGEWGSAPTRTTQ